MLFRLSAPRGVNTKKESGGIFVVKRGTIVLLVVLLVGSFASAVLAQEQVKLTWWGWFPTQEDFEWITKAFEAEHPHIQLEAVRYDYDNYVNLLRLEMATGKGPDILSMQVGALLNAMKPFLLDLDPHLGAWVDQIVPAAMEEAYDASVNGLYLVPVGMSAQGYVFYNHTLFEQAGITVPTTGDEFKATVAKLKEAYPRQIPFAVGLRDQWFATDMFMLLANMVSPGVTERADKGEIRWDSAPFVEAMQLFKELVDQDVIMKDSVGLTAYEGAIGMWLDRQAIMFTMGSWNMGNLSLEHGDRRRGRATDNDILGAFVLPNFAGHDPVVIGGIDLGMAVNKNSLHVAEAMKVIEFMTVGKGQAWFTGRPGAGLIPAQLGMEKDMSAYPHPVEQAGIHMFGEAYASYRVASREVSNLEVKNQLAIELQNIIVGKDIARALRDLQRVADRQ